MAQEQARKRQFWTDEEDARLVQLVAVNGVHNWTGVADGLRGRDSKSCSLRWRYFLAPHIIRSTEEKLSHWEVAVLFWGLKQHGNKWRTMVDAYLPWRSPSDLKNFANQYLVLQAKLPLLVADNPYLAAGFSLGDLLASMPPDIVERWARAREMQAASPAGGAPPKRGSRHGMTSIFRQAAKLTAARAAQQPYVRPRGGGAVKPEPPPAAAGAAGGGRSGNSSAAAVRLPAAAAAAAAATPATSGARPAVSAGAPSGTSAASTVSHASLLAAIRAALVSAGAAPRAAATAAGPGASAGPGAAGTGLLRISFLPVVPQQAAPAASASCVVLGGGTGSGASTGARSSGSAGAHHSFFTSPRNIGGSSHQPLDAGQLSVACSSSSSFVAPTGLPAALTPAFGAASGSSFSSSSSLDGSPTGAAAEQLSSGSPEAELRLPAADAGSFVGWSGLPGLNSLGLASFASSSSTGTATPCGSPHKQAPTPQHLLPAHIPVHSHPAALPAWQLPDAAVQPPQPQQPETQQPPQHISFQQLLLSDWTPPPAPAAATEPKQSDEHAAAAVKLKRDAGAGQAAAEGAALPEADQEGFAELAQILFGRHATSEDDTLLQAAAAAAADAAFADGPHGGGARAPAQAPPAAGAGPACPLLETAGAADGGGDDLGFDFELGALADWMDLGAGGSGGGAACWAGAAAGGAGGAPCAVAADGVPELAVSPSVTALLEQMDSVEAFRHLPGWS